MVPPLLEIVFDVRLELQTGSSLSNSLEKVLKTRTDPVSLFFKRCHVSFLSGDSVDSLIQASPYFAGSSSRRFFLKVIERGLRGSPVDQVLKELQWEILKEIECRTDEYLQLLPIKVLLPLVFLVFPGVVALIAGPIAMFFLSHF